MKKLFILLGILYAGYIIYNLREIPQPPEDLNVVMYSSTTCGYCKQKARELAENKIGHVEYFIDVDSERANELDERIRQAKMPIQPYGTPIFAIYGEVIPNNPSINEIQSAIARHRNNG